MSKTFDLRQAQVVFVSDFFVEQYIGGAELTMEAIIDASPYRVAKIQCSKLTRELVEKYKDTVHWVLVNYTGLHKDVLIDIANDCNYSIIECDYKYCRYRSSHLHVLNEQTTCMCHTDYQGKFTKGLFKRASTVWFMSQEQLDEYCTYFPVMKTWTHLKVQGSTWTSEHLDKLLALGATSKKENKWAVLSGASWIKNQTFVENHLKQKSVDYDLIGNLPYEHFVEKLSQYKGLCFIPAGLDTCPRIVIEAKIMGLELELGELVQIKNETWLSQSPQDLVSYLKNKPQAFWNSANIQVR